MQVSFPAFQLKERVYKRLLFLVTKIANDSYISLEYSIREAIHEIFLHHRLQLQAGNNYAMHESGLDHRS